MNYQNVNIRVLISSLTLMLFAAGGASVSANSTSGNVQLNAEVATSIAMKIVSPNDVNPDCTPESGVTYGKVNRYASSTGDDSGKMVDTFDGREGQADEINTNTSCATLSMTPNTFESTYSDVTVYTNSGTGYAVTLQSAENVSPNLVNVADSTKYILAGAITEQDGTGEQAGQKVVPGGQNLWSYKTNNGIITDWTAATTSPVAIKSYDTTTSSGDTTRVTYGISAGSNSTGKYTTKLTYTATMFDGANPYVGNVETETVPNLTISPTSLKIARKQTKTLTVTPAEGYYLSDVDCPENYTCSNYTTDKDDPASAETQNIAVKNESAPSTAVTVGLEVTKLNDGYMHEFSASAHSSDPIGTTYELVDTRDGEEYTAAKLNDGKIWMTQDLRLGGDSDMHLTSAYSSVPAAGFTLKAINNNIWCADHNSACYDQSLTSRSATGSGNLYNWYTATAGAGTWSLTNTTVNYSICPANWNLPTGGPNSEQVNLSLAYGGPSNAASSQQTAIANLMNQPTPGFAWTGYHYPGISSASNVNIVLYWSRTAANLNYYSYFFYIEGDTVNPQYAYNFYRNIGMAVRCVAAS